MKRLMTASALAIASTLAPLSQAAPLYHPSGSNLTYGAVSNGQSITSDITNPAAGAAVLQQDGNQYRLGIPGSLGAGFEFGQVDQLYDRINAEADKFQTTQNLTNITSPAAAVTEINDAIASLNSVLADVQTNGYAKAFGSANIPLAVAHKGLGGSLVFNAGGSFVTRATGLHETVTFNSVQALAGVDDPTDDINIAYTGLIPTGFTVDNDSTVLIKASLVRDMSLGYSRSLMKRNEAELYVGARAHYYTVEQSQLNVRMANLVDVQQQFKDAMDQDRSSDSGISMDVGLLWVSENYRLGGTLTNINEPSFKGAAADLTGYDPSSSVAQRLLANGTYVMERQLSVEASLYTASKNWVISGGLDANAAKDALGDEYQWATVSAAYATDTWWLPGIRAGLRKNLAGTEINYFTLGATLAMLNLDVAWSSDTVTIDGSSVPRGAMINLGLEIGF